MKILLKFFGISLKISSLQIKTKVDKIILHLILLATFCCISFEKKRKETFAFYSVCPFFIPRKASTWKTIAATNSSLNFCWILIFRWNLYKADIFIKRIPFTCCNGVLFIEVPLYFIGKISGRSIAQVQK